MTSSALPYIAVPALAAVLFGLFCRKPRRLDRNGLKMDFRKAKELETRKTNSLAT